MISRCIIELKAPSARVGLVWLIVFGLTAAALLAPQQPGSAVNSGPTYGTSTDHATPQVANFEILSGLGGEASIAANPRNDRNLVIAHNPPCNGCASTGPGWAVSFSVDGGLSWMPSQDPEPIVANTGLFDPGAVFDSLGNLYFSYEYLDNRNFAGIQEIHVAKSTDGGATFSQVRTVARPGTVLNFKSGATRLASKYFDLPKIAVDPRNNNLYVTFAIVLEGDPTMAFYQALTRSTDGGSTWAVPLILTADDPATGPTYDAFNTWGIVVAANGDVYVPLPGFVFISRNGGIDFSAQPVSFAGLASGCPSPGNCGGYVNWVMAADPSLANRTYLAFPAIPSGRADYDLFVSRSDDSGLNWSTPVRVNDDTTKNQTTPFLSTSPTGRLDVIWYDQRNINDSEVLDHQGWSDVYYSYSTDGGSSFSANVRLTPFARVARDFGSTVSFANHVVAAYGRKSDPIDPNYTLNVYANLITFEVRFSDNFDDCNIGDWTTSVGTGNWVEASSAQSYSAPCSLHTLKASGNANPARATSTKVNLSYSDDYYLDLRFLLPSGVTERGMLIADDGRAYVTLPGSGGTGGWNLEFDGGNGTVQVQVSAGVWHRLQIFYHPSQGYYDAVVDGTLAASFVGFLYAPLEQLSVGTDASVTRRYYGEVYFDDVRYVGSPPPVGVQISAPWSELALYQTMSLTAHAQFAGAPVSGAYVSFASTSGLSVSPASGTTGADGAFTTTVKGMALGNQSVSAIVSAPALSPAVATYAIGVIHAKYLSMALAYDTWEMMSYEKATVLVRLVDETDTGVAGGDITTSSSLGGNFSAVMDQGAGDYVFEWYAPLVTAPTNASAQVQAQVGGYMPVFCPAFIRVDPNMTNPSDPTPLFLTAETDTPTLHSGGTAYVTIHLQTAEGYAVRGATIAVRSSGSLKVSSVSYGLNGVYYFTVTAGTIKKNTSVTLTITATKYGYAQGTGSLTLLLAP